jgi:hypothetical protein
MTLWNWKHGKHPVPEGVAGVLEGEMRVREQQPTEGAVE